MLAPHDSGALIYDLYLLSQALMLKIKVDLLSKYILQNEQTKF